MRPQAECDLEDGEYTTEPVTGQVIDRLLAIGAPGTEWSPCRHKARRPWRRSVQDAAHNEPPAWPGLDQDQKHKPDDHGLLETRAKDCFCVRVAPASLDRAMRILQALADAFSARGHELLEGDEHGSALRVRVQGEVLSVSLTERVKRHPHFVTEKEEIQQELNSWWKPPTYDWVPTGILALRIENASGHPQRATMRDQATGRLEQRLNGFLARLAEEAKALKAQREAAELQREKWAAAEKAREEARQKAEVEAARFRRVDHLARLWQRRETLVGFVAAVKERMKIARPELVPAAQAWVDWTEAYLEEHRPVDVLFFEPLLGRNVEGFYHWTGSYGERNEWLEEW